MPAGLAWQRPRLPSDLMPALERHPDGVEALPGYIWVATFAKMWHVAECALEFQENRGGGGT
jgi:hypothetical protein